MLKEYRRGAINISFGSNLVTGFDTSWLTYCRSGDTLRVGDQSMEVLSVTSNTEIVLVETWAGMSGNGLPYRIEIDRDGIARAKEIKMQWVLIERNIRCVADVEAFGRLWQADPTSQDLLNKAVGLATAGAPLPSVWRDVSNSNMPITSLEQLATIGGAMAAQTEAVYHRSWELKEAINTAETVEELNAIEW